MSWIQQSRWDALSPEEQRKFSLFCPDFVLELLSPSDNLFTIQKKMQEYLASGIELGWLIDPENHQVELYRQGQAVETVSALNELSGEAVLSGFVLKLDWFWRSIGEDR